MKKLKFIIAMTVIGLLLSACSGNANKPSQSSMSEQKSSESISSEADTDVGNTSESGMLSSFTTVDIDQNKVDSSVLKGKKLTMVNIWATYCSPCINEMPELAEISSEYKDKDFQIIGMPIDTLNSDGSVSDDQIKEAKSVIDSTGADYLHILPSLDSMTELISTISAVPTTVFVDENGNQIGDTYVGAKTKEDWESVIDGLLKEVEK
ncbi:MAG: TlpA family protein disulfide reductase [Clostridia bacterium]|jgi:thiol-disulfide isomerase/thioredoxin|nr:TlpA family protein disulfide reductase [Clostridia bacterium]MCI2001157.1 TlpA family protein disulfide reductase [Clostridia bacterium]MCI2015847.1 TlpA family protein disulfide reductase [Clostridia bacterium]